uniref:Uncharacterized protein n=1 Tax=Meloidogyne enterolobii TaxID=390850 RepID=A0A6V7UYI6_MELEN|nr:unnamed protein product [Meloidogyne enterolobii]
MSRLVNTFISIKLRLIFQVESFPIDLYDRTRGRFKASLGPGEKFQCVFCKSSNTPSCKIGLLQ